MKSAYYLPKYLCESFSPCRALHVNTEVLRTRKRVFEIERDADAEVRFVWRSELAMPVLPFPMLSPPEIAYLYRG
jgi:hypothetical protein